MARSLGLSDFRSRRCILEYKDFALIEPSDPPPISKRIKPSAWHAIQDLPDDVSIRTSDWHGKDLKIEVALANAWQAALGEDRDVIWSAMLDIHDEFQASIFCRLHGFYRLSITSLRSALELVAIGFRFQNSSEDTAYTEWLSGNTVISFGSILRDIQNFTPVARINGALVSKDRKRFAAERGTPNEVYELYSELCRFNHSRPGATDAALWQSNGPIFDQGAFRLSHGLYLKTISACWLLARLGKAKLPLPPRFLRQEVYGTVWAENRHQ